MAEEIRGLGDRTGGLAGQIQAAARSIDMGATDVLRAMEDTARVAQDGRTSAHSARETLAELGDAFAGVFNDVENITALTRAQHEGARDVVSGIEEIAAVARRNAQGTDETSAAVAAQHLSAGEMARSAQVLAATASDLREHLGLFQRTPGSVPAVTLPRRGTS